MHAENDAERASAAYFTRVCKRVKGRVALHGEEDAEDESAVYVPEGQDAREDETSDPQPGTEYVVRRQICHVLAVIPVNLLGAGAVAIPVCSSRTHRIKERIVDGTVPYFGPYVVVQVLHQLDGAVCNERSILRHHLRPTSLL